MQSMDHEVLAQTLQWLEGGVDAWLCTIVTTVCSSPRLVGSIVAVSANGQQIGSVSGGCVEEDLLERIAAGEFPRDRSTLVDYGLSAEENERLGLPCGGRMSLLLQALGQKDAGWVRQILDALHDRCIASRTVSLGSGETLVSTVPEFQELQIDQQQLQQCFGPRQRMLLVGAGQLATTLSELAQAMDYEVIVTDPRENLLNQWNGPAVELVQGMPDDVVRDRASDSHSLVITLTHDPRIDDMALMEALESDAWYVGALGSMRTTEKRILRLRQLGISEDAIARMRAPVGISIGSKTPLEIAISIMAELTALRARAGTTAYAATNL